MKVRSTDFNDLFVIEPDVFEDERGYFFESFNKQEFLEKTGLDLDFVQDNESMSHKGALRGLHFQRPPYAQGKLVRVQQGAVLDVCVDLRTDEPTYGKHFSMELNALTKKALYVPPGFAHGFHTLADNTVFQYKCTEYYHKNAECTLLWNDPELQISWNAKAPLISQKDKEGVTFEALSKEVIFGDTVQKP